MFWLSGFTHVCKLFYLLQEEVPSKKLRLILSYLSYVKLNPKHEEIRRVVDGLLHHDSLEVALFGGDALHRRRAHHVGLGVRQGAVVRLLWGLKIFEGLAGNRSFFSKPDLFLLIEGYEFAFNNCICLW